MLTATYPIRLPVFEGPLDLLLELIEERQLDITAVSLAQVADQYLAVIEELGRRTLADLTGFLVVAAKLLVIKSRVLLPDYRAGEGEEDEDTAEFIQQLEVYQFFRRMARELERLEERGWRCYVRVGKSGDRRLPPDPRLYLEGVTLEESAGGGTGGVPGSPLWAARGGRRCPHHSHRSGADGEDSGSPSAGRAGSVPGPAVRGSEPGGGDCHPVGCAGTAEAGPGSGPSGRALWANFCGSRGPGDLTICAVTGL